MGCHKLCVDCLCYHFVRPSLVKCGRAGEFYLLLSSNPFAIGAYRLGEIHFPVSRDRLGKEITEQFAARTLGSRVLTLCYPYKLHPFCKKILSSVYRWPAFRLDRACSPPPVYRAFIDDEMREEEQLREKPLGTLSRAVKSVQVGYNKKLRYGAFTSEGLYQLQSRFDGA
jgi:hypothetical protein